MNERGIGKNYLTRHRRHRTEYNVSDESTLVDILCTMMRRVWVNERLLRGTF